METISGQPQSLDTTTKWMPVTTGWKALLTLTCKSSANTNPLLKKAQILWFKSCWNQVLQREGGGEGHPPKQQQNIHLKTHKGYCNPYQPTPVKPASTILPFVNIQTGKSRLKRVTNRIEAYDYEPWHTNHKGQPGVGASFSTHWASCYVG